MILAMMMAGSFGSPDFARMLPLAACVKVTFRGYRLRACCITPVLGRWLAFFSIYERANQHLSAFGGLIRGYATGSVVVSRESPTDILNGFSSVDMHTSGTRLWKPGSTF